MLNLIQKDDLNEYTRPSQWVDYETPEIQKKALELSQDMDCLLYTSNTQTGLTSDYYKSSLIFFRIEFVNLSFFLRTTWNKAR